MKKTVSLFLCLVMLAGLLCGCKPETVVSETGLPVGYTVENDENNEYYFMNRNYAVTATDTDTTAAELERAGKWLSDYVLDSATTGKSAFDFKIGGISFIEAISEWTLSTELGEESDDAKQYTLTYTKEGEPLTVTVYATAYKNYAVIEWTIWIENTGSTDSQNISEFYGLNHVFAEEFADGDYNVTSFNGGLDNAESFRPETETLAVDHTKTRSNTGGRSSSGSAPYVSLAWENPDAAWGREGVFISLGWSGEWDFVCTNTGAGLKYEGRQLRLNTYLKPGEKVRSPLMSLLFWEKDFMRSQNLWRRWLYNVALLQPGDEPMKPIIYGSLGGSFTDGTQQKQLQAMDTWAELGFDIDGWQMDAGWYDVVIDGEWSATGTWVTDPDRYEKDLSAIGNKADENDWIFILWYEPERFITNSQWYNDFSGTDWMIKNIGNTHTLNLSSDEVTDFLIDFITKSLGANNVDVYRQDCNIVEPSLKSAWQSIDEENRDGLSENKYIVNYLRYYDAVLDYLGDDSFIDSCASGGKRMDLETLKRSFTLWRDDACYTPAVTQSHSWSYNFLFPYSGQGNIESNFRKVQYAFRSNLMTSMALPWDIQKAAGDIRLENVYRSSIAEFREFAPYMTADYYPLTAFNGSQEGWIVWQFNDYKENKGIVQAFRRFTDDNAISIWLSGLEADTLYHVEDIDNGVSLEATGRELMQNGFEITILKNNTASILRYYPAD